MGFCRRCGHPRAGSGYAMSAAPGGYHSAHGDCCTQAAGQTKAPRPVMARPTMSVLISRVPS
jgi:hypothetical protein